MLGFVRSFKGEELCEVQWRYYNFIVEIVDYYKSKYEVEIQRVSKKRTEKEPQTPKQKVSESVENNSNERVKVLEHELKELRTSLHQYEEFVS